MTDKVLSDLRRIAQTYPTVGVQDAIIAAITEIERTRADLAAARSLLREVQAYAADWRKPNLLDARIDAALGDQQ